MSVSRKVGARQENTVSEVLRVGRRKSEVQRVVE